MRIAGVIHESVVDGPGVRFVVFTQGCSHHCKGCHNPETWDPSGGSEVTVRTLLKDIRKAPKSVTGVTLSGGEPFMQAGEVADLAKRIHELSLAVATYSGYTFEVLNEMAKDNIDIKRLLDETDILVDGPFIESLKDISLRFKGSCNQRVIDMNATRTKGELVLLPIDLE